MHVDRMSQAVCDFLEEAGKLTWRKNADYHPDKVAYLEVLQTACDTNITVEQDLWARIRKQMSAIRRFVIEGHVESETPRSRMIDVSVYMGMMCVWVENKKSILSEALIFVNTKRQCEKHGGLNGKKTCFTEESALNYCERCVFLAWLRRYVDQTR